MSDSHYGDETAENKNIPQTEQPLSLGAIREEIDHIDAALLPLLCRRMDCSRQVAAYKAAHDMPVLNPKREEEILRRVKESCGQLDSQHAGYGDAAALIFSAMMDVSRALQHRQLGAGGELRQRLVSAFGRLIPGDRARVACAGCAGAYADKAAGYLFPETQEERHRPLFVSSFADVFAAVRDGRADYGVLPVENSSTGSVNEVYDLMMAHRFSIAAAVEVPIRHCLLAVDGASMDTIKTVYSHHQGLSQCAEFIASKGWEAQPFANTAMAARMVAEKGDISIAAIASEQSGHIYGLNTLSNDIQIVKNNCTRFIVISSKLVISPAADRISLIFGLPHTTGSLYKVLARFAAQGLNLTKIESRPIRTGDFEYAFYLDFEGSVTQKGTMDLLCALSEELPFFTFLGNYQEWKPDR